MSDPTTPGSEGRRVLVVDDDADVRFLLTTLLENKGFSVVGATCDGAEAVAESYEDQPDFVVLDYMMPNVNGAIAASFIRATCPSAHIIAFSGAGLKDVGWADDYLDKSDITQLPVLLEETARKRAKTRASA